MKKQLFSLLALLLMVAGGAVAQTENTASVRQLTRNADGDWVLDQMPDFDGVLQVTFYEQFRLDSIPLAWTIMVNGVDSSAGVTAYTEGDTTKGWLNILEGSFVELIPPTVVKPKVSNVTVVEASAPAGLTLNLATVTTDTTVGDGYTLTGTLGADVKISIADGATVTLDGVTINRVSSVEWAGITCLGDATIILSGTDTVKGFSADYPGIYVPQNKTLTIQGSGSLTASSNGWGCGIGGGYNIACGNIVIDGGTITANGGNTAAGIGGGYGAGCGNISITGGTITANGGSNGAGIGSGGYQGSCGNISITGGTVTANGGSNAAGIGGGYNGQCGTVTITNGVTSVTATKGNLANYSIGRGYGSSSTCGTVTVMGAQGEISQNPYTYPEAN